jgi:membrane-bound lytic murein transglycosylase A
MRVLIRNLTTIISLFIISIFIACICYLYFFTEIFGFKPRFVKTTFAQLPNWQHDDLTYALTAFKNSCTAIMKLNPETSMHAILQYGKAKDWQTVCLAAHQVNLKDKEKIRVFFESRFEPYHVLNQFKAKGLFTGYYLPIVHGDLKKRKTFNVPMYGLPKDLVKVNLPLFKPELSNQTLIGQLKDHILYPYPDRALINNGAIKKQARVLVWSNSLVDVFFAQIQGSCIVKLPHHKQIVLGYVSGNGKPYTAIGKVLVKDYGLKKSEISMQSIRAWLTSHPKEVNKVLNQNANYVFFRILKNTDPLGCQQVPLTTERSLAVDTRFIALGTPIWLSTSMLDKDHTEKTAFDHLLIAQDTGGDIKGMVRGDVYWGGGERAAFVAGHMASPGEYWVLLPKK